MNRKKRRHSGYRSPDAIISKKELLMNDLFINPFYDDWCDYRDGLRDWFSDFKKIKRFIPLWAQNDLKEKRIRMNVKQKTLLYRRLRKKNHPRNSLKGIYY